LHIFEIETVKRISSGSLQRLAVSVYLDRGEKKILPLFRLRVLTECSCNLSIRPTNDHTHTISRLRAIMDEFNVRSSLVGVMY
jgi:hypothetical protein